MQERSEWSAEKQRLNKEVEQLHELVEYLLDQIEVPLDQAECLPSESSAEDMALVPSVQPSETVVPRIPLETVTSTIDSVPIFSP